MATSVSAVEAAADKIVVDQAKFEQLVALVDDVINGAEGQVLNDLNGNPIDTFRTKLALLGAGSVLGAVVPDAVDPLNPVNLGQMAVVDAKVDVNAASKLNKNFDNAEDADAALQILMPDGFCPQPNAPRFSIAPYNQALTAIQTDSVISMNVSPIFDSGDFDFITNRFVAPSDGLYFFGYNLRIDGLNSSYFRTRTRLNGIYSAGLGHRLIGSYAHGNYFTSTSTVPYEMSEGDYVDLTVYSYADTTYSIHEESNFYGFKVH